MTDVLAPVEKLLNDTLDCATSFDLSMGNKAADKAREAVRLLLDVARDGIERYDSVGTPEHDEDDGYYDTARALLAFARSLQASDE